MASGTARSRNTVDPRVDQNISTRKRSSVFFVKKFMVKEHCNTSGKRMLSVKTFLVR